MRIPFDLIAAVLAMDAIVQSLSTPPHATGADLPSALLAWAAFLLVTWLLNELVTRHVEWRTRFGFHVSGLGGRHPLVEHTWGIRVAEALSVATYAFVLWSSEWPLFVAQWPEWLGFDPQAHIGELPLAKSAVAVMLLNLSPFLSGMLLAWLPRRRLASGLRRRQIPLLAYLGYEARLAWLPLVLWLSLSALADIASILPSEQTAWLATPGLDVVLLLAILVFLSLIGIPKLVIWMWECRPMPDGPLRDRLLSVMARSGVKARAILVWGPRGSGLLNACVLGPWAPFRYVLISPQLVDELGMEETEAVLAHELGHARHGHLTLLFVMLLCMSALLDPLSKLLPAAPPLAQAGVLIAFILAYIFFFFGAMMRQCEREADLASAEIMGTPAPLVAALEKLAYISGNIRNVYCWHHGSIADRVDAVQRLSLDPLGSIRLHARLRRLRIALVVVAVVALSMQFIFRMS